MQILCWRARVQPQRTCNMVTKVRFVHGQGIGAAIHSRCDPHACGASAEGIQSATCSVLGLGVGLVLAFNIGLGSGSPLNTSMSSHGSGDNEMTSSFGNIRKALRILAIRPTFLSNSARTHALASFKHVHTRARRRARRLLCHPAQKCSVKYG